MALNAVTRRRVRRGMFCRKYWYDDTLRQAVLLLCAALMARHGDSSACAVSNWGIWGQPGSCNTISLQGSAPTFNGMYDKQASQSGGRATYAQVDGDYKLYYLDAVNGWVVGASVGSTAVAMYNIDHATRPDMITNTWCSPSRQGETNWHVPQHH